MATPQPRASSERLAAGNRYRWLSVSQSRGTVLNRTWIRRILCQPSTSRSTPLQKLKVFPHPALSRWRGNFWLPSHRSARASATTLPSPTGRGCAGTWSRGPDSWGCDRGGAHKHAGDCGAASRSGVASKHNTLGTCSALRGRRGEGRAAKRIFAKLVRRPSAPARGDTKILGSSRRDGSW